MIDRARNGIKARGTAPNEVRDADVCLDFSRRSVGFSSHRRALPSGMCTGRGPAAVEARNRNSITGGGESGASGFTSTGSGGSTILVSAVPIAQHVDRHRRIEWGRWQERRGWLERELGIERQRGLELRGTGGKGGSSNSGGSGGTNAAHDAGTAGSGSGGSNLGSCSADGGLPSGMMLLSEDFEDGAANGWVSPVPADWSVVDDGGKVYKQSVSQGNSTVHLSAAGDASWTNVVIEARVKPLIGGSSSSYFAGVCARLKDAKNSTVPRFAPTANLAFVQDSTATGRISATPST